VDLVLLRGDTAEAETLHNRQQRVYVPDRNHRLHGRICTVTIGAVPRQLAAEADGAGDAPGRDPAADIAAGGDGKVCEEGNRRDGSEVK